MRKQRTRAAIVEAGIQLFGERGFTAVTVADIAEAADVAPRTFHRYFPDRDELLFADVTEHRQVVRDALEAQPFDPQRPLDTLAAVLTALASHFDGALDATRARDRLIRANPALHARDLTKQADIEDEITERLASNLGVTPDGDLRPRLWAKVGLACFFSAYRTWIIQGGTLATHITKSLAALP